MNRKKRNNGNLFYLRWGDGPNNSLVINTGTLIEENDIYDINKSQKFHIKTHH